MSSRRKMPQTRRQGGNRRLPARAHLKPRLARQPQRRSRGECAWHCGNLVTVALAGIAQIKLNAGILNTVERFSSQSPAAQCTCRNSRGDIDRQESCGHDTGSCQRRGRHNRSRQPRPRQRMSPRPPRVSSSLDGRKSRRVNDAVPGRYSSQGRIPCRPIRWRRFVTSWRRIWTRNRQRSTMVLWYRGPYPLQLRSTQPAALRARVVELTSYELYANLPVVVFLCSALSFLQRHSCDGSVHFICMNWRHAGEVLQAGKKAYDRLLNLCVWTKDSGGMGSFYRSQHELIFVFRKGKEPHRNNVQLGQFGRNRTNVWRYPGMNTLSKSAGEGNLPRQTLSFLDPASISYI